jgi:polyphenol oxidase
VNAAFAGCSAFPDWSVKLLTSPLLSKIPNISHGFGDLAEPLPHFAIPYWSDRPIKTQVHGMRICAVHEKKSKVGEADGLFTTAGNLLLTLVNADCFPVLLARLDGAAVMALHVGWRGALGGIVKEAAELISRNGDHPKHWVAAIGPGARACCYEVSQELIERFSSGFALPRNLIEPSHRKLDLPSLIGWQLKAFGFSAFSDMGACTICSKMVDGKGNTQPAFFSYRRDHGESVQRSVIVRV